MEESNDDEFYLAISDKCLDRVRACIWQQKVADINAFIKSGRTALHYAIKLNDLETVKFLIDQGANVNCSTKYKYPCLHLAVLGSLDEAGTKPSRDPTHVRNNTEIFKILLSRAKDVDAKDDLGRSALHLAIAFGNKNLIELLLQRGANVNERTSNVIQETSLHYTIKHSTTSDRSIEIINSLLKYGARINAVNKKGETALHHTARLGFTELANHLLAKGANIDYVSEEFLTPLTMSVKKYKFLLTKLLLQKGAKVNIKTDKHDNALHIALKYGAPDEKRKRLVKLLLIYGADVTQENWDRQTPLMMCGPADEECALVLVNYMVLLHERGNQIDSKNLAIIQHERKYAEHFQLCLQELQKMKFAIIDNNISFYDILTQEHNSLVKCTQNKCVLSVFKSKRYLRDYPQYSDFINQNFLKGQERHDLIIKSVKSLTSLIPKLPFQVATMICEKLSNRDLTSLKGCRVSRNVRN